MSLYKNYTLIAKSKSVNFSDDIELERASAGGYIGDTLKGAAAGAAAGAGTFMLNEKVLDLLESRTSKLKDVDWNKLNSFISQNQGSSEEIATIMKKMTNPKDQQRFFQKFLSAGDSLETVGNAGRIKDALKKAGERGPEILANGLVKSVPRAKDTVAGANKIFDAFNVLRESIEQDPKVFEKLADSLKFAQPRELESIIVAAKSGTSEAEKLKQTLTKLEEALRNNSGRLSDELKKGQQLLTGLLGKNGMLPDNVTQRVAKEIEEATRKIHKEPARWRIATRAGKQFVDDIDQAIATKSPKPFVPKKMLNKKGKALAFVLGGAAVVAVAAALTKRYVSSIEHNIDTMIRKDQRIGYKLSDGWFGLSKSPIKKYLIDNARLNEIQNSYINALKSWYKDPRKFEIKGMNITGVTIEKPELQYVAMSVKPKGDKATAELKLYYKTEAKIKGQSTLKSEGGKPKSIDATSYDQVTVYLITDKSQMDGDNYNTKDVEHLIGKISDFGETGGLQELSPPIKWALLSDLKGKYGIKQNSQDFNDSKLFQERHMKPIFNLKAALQNASASENNLPEKLIGYDGKTIKQPLDTFGFNPALLEKTNLVIQPFGINLGV